MTLTMEDPDQIKSSNFARFHLESAKKYRKTSVFWHFPDQTGQNLNFFLVGILYLI